MHKWPWKNLGEANHPDRCRKADKECMPQESAAATSCTRCRVKKLTCQVNGETRCKVKMEAMSGLMGLGGGRVEELLGEILAVLKKNEKSICGLTEVVHDILGELTDPMFCLGDIQADDYEAKEEDLAESERAVHEAKANEIANVGQTPGPYSKEAFNMYWADLQNCGEVELQWRAWTTNSPEDEAEYQTWMKVEEEAREAQFAPAHMEGEQVEEVTGPSMEPNMEPSTGPTAGSKTGTVDDDEDEEDEEDEEQEQGEEKEWEPGPEGMEGVEKAIEGLTMEGVE